MTVAATLLDDRYSLEEEIGTGGFCEVWRATDTVLARPVAVKLLHPGYAGEPEARARFKDEARHAGALSHENIARVYDYGEPACGPSYLVMELIGGPSLAAVLAGGPLGAARTMDIVAQVAAGLQAAHSAGLVHRDIKPSNILFTSESTVFTSESTARITDFGIAHAVGAAPLTTTGTVIGTPGYIAPERVAGAQAGPASDLYALGIVAFECLAGAPPFSGPPLEVAIAHRDRPLPPLPAWLPAEVAAFVMGLTAKDPDLRPADAGEAARRARRLRDQLMSGALGTPPRRQSRGAVRPRALGAAALAAFTALTCLVMLTATGFANASRPSSGPSQAAPSATRSPSPASSAAKPVAAVSHAPARHRHGRKDYPDAGDGDSGN